MNASCRDPAPDDADAAEVVASPLDADACYAALVARDRRFDGRFVVAVSTTGVYCRPVCRVRTPGRDRCSFFRRGAEAEAAGYRACLRCRPELAPRGIGVDDVVSRLVAAAVRRIEAGALNDDAAGDGGSGSGSASVDALADRLGVSARHLRRAMKREIGVTPVELAQSTRVALAKALLQDTRLPLTEVALASGFASVRRFNALFKARFGRPPGEIRRAGAASALADAPTVRLGYRPPLAWEPLMAFLGARATKGVEVVTGEVYARTASVGGRDGWLAVRRDAARAELRVHVSAGLLPALMPLVARVRAVFDADADPDAIAARLGGDDVVGAVLARVPGLRVPGAFDPFELCVRAVLGQQVSVKAATTLSGRFASAFGRPLVAEGFPELTHLTPEAARVAAADVAEIAAIGLPSARARTILGLAEAFANKRVALAAGDDPDAAARALEALPGIGPWTAQYVAMRALGAPDAFPDGDLVLRKALGGATPAAVKARAERWRPFRAYAALALWNATPEELAAAASREG